MLNTRDLVQFTSPPTAVGMTLTYAGKLVDRDFDAVPVVRVLATVLFVIVLAALCLRPRGRRRRWRAPCARRPGPGRHGCARTYFTVVCDVAVGRDGATTLQTADHGRGDRRRAAGPPDGGGLARFVKFRRPAPDDRHARAADPIPAPGADPVGPPPSTRDILARPERS